MTTPDDRPTRDDAHEPQDVAGTAEVMGEVTADVTADVAGEPADAEPDDTPAWADADAFADAADEPGYEAFALEQDLTGGEPAATEPTATEPGPEPEPGPAEPAPEAEPVPLTEPAAEPLEAPAPEPLEAPAPEPLIQAPTTRVHDSGSQVPGSALTGDQVAGERVVPPSPAPVLPPVPVAPPVVMHTPPPEPAPPAVTAEEPAVEELAEESGEQAEEPVAAVPGGGPRTRLLAAAVAVLAVLALVLGALAWSAGGPGSLQAERDAALDAARSGARAVFSYDYRHLEKDFAAGKAVTTGGFRQEYERTTGKLVDDVAARYKAVVVADVGAAAVVTANHGRVLVLVFVDQQSSSTLTAQPKLTQSRLELTMVERDGHWLIEKIRAF